jgi:ribonucleoside-triphosphate reductase (thioredoxin)
MDNYSKFIAASRYARWQDSEGRRETWEETAARYVSYWGNKLGNEEKQKITSAIVNLEVMPSMRCVMTAGPALDRDNVAGFNCSYLPIDHPKAFDELMYILMCGTGVGFSVERQYIAKLPEIAEKLHPTDTTIDVADSKIGWAKAMRQLIAMLYAGEVPSWDVSKVRAAGERLKIFGGRASGPKPLVDLFQYTVDAFKKAAGRKLNSLECHDLCCKIAEVIVVGGVRRSALISLSNPSDGRLRNAKSGQWWEEQGQRALANNSACYTEKPEFNFFMDEMKALYDSKSGERGVFSRVAAQKIAARNKRREANHDFGTNPCSEIILRPNQFCNLSEVVVREDDTLDSLKEKVRIAAILGTL